MARQTVEQKEFERWFGQIEVRHLVSEQLRNFVTSNDYAGVLDTFEAVIEDALRDVERKGYARKTLIRNSSDKRRQIWAEDGAPYLAMYKNWGRREKETGSPAPKGSRTFALATLYYFFRNIGNPTYFITIIEALFEPSDFVFQRLYFAKVNDGPKNPRFSEVCARYFEPGEHIAAKFVEVWNGQPLAVGHDIFVGPVRFKPDSDRQSTLTDVASFIQRDLFPEGQPDVFAALDWRAGLSSLQGRSEKTAGLLAWALKPAELVEAVLVHGPGGVGKSRLIAETLRTLVEDYHWHVASISGSAVKDISFDPRARGIALFVDYPEEQTPFVIALLRALEDGASVDLPIKIFLASRETPESWLDLANRPHIRNLSSVSLVEDGHLNDDEAQALACEINCRYPALVAKAAANLEDLQAWLEQDGSHRIPLIVTAACVHAILAPQRAFGISGHHVLIELAKIERRRVRGYSQRDFKEETTLEKILALSTLTPEGFDKKAVYDFGTKELSSNLSGAALFDAARRTPYWTPKTVSRKGLLPKLQPDRLAAAFFYLVFLSDETPPSLPSWLVPGMRLSGPAYVSILARVCMDVSLLDLAASALLENVAVETLSIEPDLGQGLAEAVHDRTPTFATAFVAELAQLLLMRTNEPNLRASLANALANRLSELGDPKAALTTAQDAAQVFEELCKSDGGSQYQQDLAMALNNLGNRHSDLGEYAEAEAVNKRSCDVYQELIDAGDNHLSADMANAMHNYSSVLADRGKSEEALKVALGALAIREQLTEEEPEEFTVDLASSKNNLANILADLGRHDEALKYTNEALHLHRQFAKISPETFEPELANSLLNASIRHADLELFADALDFADEAVSRFKRLSEVRPKAYQCEHARALNNLALRQDSMELSREAYRTAKLALAIYETLPGDLEDTVTLDHALALNTIGNIAMDFEKGSQPVGYFREAVALLADVTDRSGNRYLSDYAMALNNLANAQSERDELDAAEITILDAIKIYDQLVQRNRELYLADLASALVNQSEIMVQQGQPEAAIRTLERLVSVSEDLAVEAPEEYGLELALTLQMLTSLQHDLGLASEAKENADRMLAVIDIKQIDDETFSSMKQLQTKCHSAI